jgi:cytochrome c oxidase cbb3-type subunit 3
VIKYGVPEKGMIAWEKQLKPQQIQHVASFILSQLVGSTPAAPKEPQGEEWKGAGGEVAASDN